MTHLDVFLKDKTATEGALAFGTVPGRKKKGTLSVKLELWPGVGVGVLP